MSNVTFITFNEGEEVDALVEVYSTINYLVSGIDQMIIKFTDFSRNESLPKLPDVFGYNYYNWYSEDDLYKFDNLEYEIEDSFEYLKEGYELNPYILIIHDANRFYSYEDLYNYFESKVGLLEMINMYIYCTIRL